ncbi:MAG: permease [Winogradskyella sp.]|uniref:Bax inhibitor-1/YccA family protein n=1 Tax=Winogradskyella sp. TaxID=1883156 RepID=UPI000F3DF99A|nr:Bax inhibitor-1 family protein [Winogradskyella sp.]RNC87795.1 MAG: permease [Winogradskyella sp.]
MENQIQGPIMVGHLEESEKATFYRKTYTHVAFAILGFMLLEYIFIGMFEETVVSIINLMFANSFSWLIVLGLFWVGSTMADKLAHDPSRQTQYMGLGLYVLLEAIIFLPMIYLAAYHSSGTAMLTQATIITLCLFGGLTAVVFMSNQNFSFLKTGLVIGTFIAVGLIVAGSIFGFDLGLWFSVAMVVFAGAAILYQTSKVKYEYTGDQYVGAALGIFASVMLLFWYVLQILMSRD